MAIKRLKTTGLIQLNDLIMKQMTSDLVNELTHSRSECCY